MQPMVDASTFNARADLLDNFRCDPGQTHRRYIPGAASLSDGGIECGNDGEGEREKKAIHGATPALISKQPKFVPSFSINRR